MRGFVKLCIFALLIFAGLSMPMVSSAKTKSIATPTNVRARDNDYKRLKVKWKKVKKADGYQVYEYKAAKKKYVKVADVGAKVTSWKSKNTKKEHTYKVRAYRKTGKKRVYSKFSYAVSALPYQKNAKKVNAGFISFSEAYLDLSIYERKTISVKLKKSSYAKNKKAKVYDETIRWSSTDKSIAKVDKNGNITMQGKEGECKICARAHNGNLTWIRVYATDFATDVKFTNISVMVDDMQDLITNYQTDLEKIASFFERNEYENPDKDQKMKFSLDDDRAKVVAEVTSGNAIEYKEIEDSLLRVLQSFPGDMDITVYNGVIVFVQHGYGIQAAELYYAFGEIQISDETNVYFETALRWVYNYVRNGV